MATLVIILKIFFIIIGLLLTIWGIIETMDSIRLKWVDCTLMALMIAVGGLFVISIGIFAIT